MKWEARERGNSRGIFEKHQSILDGVLKPKDINLQSSMNALGNEISEIDYESEKRSFIQEELKLLFEHNPAAESYVNGFSKLSRFWLSMITLYTGMRIAEICQLHLSDIEQVKIYRSACVSAQIHIAQGTV
ncbi:hypothetical protein [Candidatus Methylomicrobium oryzae]|uniref:hypothetical protein n=1 Tax=Candidatus Methylomicrobium oryzae TaxID=2802053 RepID=UPI0019229457|nr:hypothetical protein [Methylomicrobium sp. RS1]MBL1262633.1 hypothetical protein [Methylomicrobium sp. RS1]